MGDTGSLALERSLGTVAVMTRHEILLAVIGGGICGRSLIGNDSGLLVQTHQNPSFLMAPIHHHFEQAGKKPPLSSVLDYLPWWRQQSALSSCCFNRRTPLLIFFA